MTVSLARQKSLTGRRRNPYDWPSPPDPGDLSRRLAARRAELRLSLSQVAERAAVNRRYLEFLENFPGQPDAGTLRRLAAALRTTPGALLGGGGQAPPGRAAGPVGRLERLSLAECGRLLARAASAGRVHHRLGLTSAGQLPPGGRHHRAADRRRVADRGARRRSGLVRDRPPG